MPYVSLDLETTGLDPETDEIIEVGAIRFDAGGVLATYHSLVNPGRALEYRISMLTGIGADELERAPHFSTIALEIEEFIGFDPVIGQNPTFDTGFLARKGVTVYGPTFDTFELAGLLLPNLRERGLGGIADRLGIEFPVRHRALADAEAARAVFVALREQLAASHPSLLAEAARLSSLSDWTLRHLFNEVAMEHARAAGDSDREGFVHEFVRAPGAIGDPIRPAADRRPVPKEEAVRLLRSDAARESLPNYEERVEQTAMARVVTETVNDGGQLVVEAGTGVGKSLAYIVPAALHAVRNSARTVISTNTINLQEQLTQQDIPIARRILSSAGIETDDLRVATMKGRANYLCLLRWSALRRSHNLTSDEARVLVQLLFWLGQTETGDRAEPQLRREEDAAWSRVSAAEGGCLTMQCPYVRDGSCFLYRARRRAESAHLLVVNHALLLSDIAAGGNVLPEYKHLVVDEAHHLEEQATRQFGFSASRDDVLTWLESLHVRSGRDRHGGLAATLVEATRATTRLTVIAAQAESLSTALSQAVVRVRDRIPPFFETLREFGQRHAGRGDEDRLLISRSIRVQPDWADIESGWFDIEEQLAQVTGIVEEITTALEQANPADVLDRDAVLAEASERLADGEALRAGLSRIVGHDDRHTVCWMTMGRNDASPSLSSAPLSVAETLNASLFGPRDSTVLTSATMTTDDRFDYIKERLGVPDARELVLGSPFDYKASTLLLSPADMPEPDQPGYAAAVQSALIESVLASDGRALVLFTSHSALRTAYNGIKRPLEEREILVLGQGIDGTPKHLLNTLREHGRAVVLGAASFWEGVDVAGEALSLLVIARLPFPVPSDPVFQARSELFEQPFEEYAVPQAILRFKQGFGRLIRSRTDRGVLIVLDRRLQSRRYGEVFLRSLPPCTFKELPARDLPQEIGGWLAPRDIGTRV